MEFYCCWAALRSFHHDKSAFPVWASSRIQPLSISTTKGGIYPHHRYGKDKAQLPFSSLVSSSLCGSRWGIIGWNYSYKRCLGGFNKNGYNLFRSHPLLYSCYEYKYLKVLRRTILRRTPPMIILLNCLADHLEKDFTISKQLVTVGLLVPAHCQLSNTCICNRHVLCT